MRLRAGPERPKPVRLRDRAPNRDSSMRHSQTSLPRRARDLAYRGPAVFASISMRTAMQEMFRLFNPLEMVFLTKLQLALSGNGSLLPATNGLLRSRSLFRIGEVGRVSAFCVCSSTLRKTAIPSYHRFCKFLNQ